jgi:hypothetical protein
MSTTGAQLNEWCRRHKVKGFLGVFCSDTLPKLWAPGDVCLIVNHSPCDSPSGGSHWLACRIQGVRAEWFDSFGQPPDSPLENSLMGSPTDPPPQFRRWLDDSGVTSVRWQDRDLQAVTSDVCGLYASYFCKHGAPKQNPKAWSWLTGDPTRNDQHIRRLVRVNRHVQ